MKILRRHLLPRTLRVLWMLPCLVLVLQIAGGRAEAGDPPALAPDTVRLAFWDVELSRKGPGLLLRDIRAGKDPQLQAAMTVIAAVSPDILMLSGLDWDLQGAALGAFRDALAQAGTPYPYLYTARPNAGLPSGQDLDGNGRLGEARDAQGYGRFSGAGGMALLSRYRVDPARSRDHSGLLWRDLPGALIEGAELSPQAMAVQRLSSVAHWDLALQLPKAELRLWAWSATPPVFDGPEDRNGRRNHDEAAFWLGYLAQAPADGRFVLMGNANLDPRDGEGRREALRALLSHPALQDLAPRSRGGLAADPAHPESAAFDTVEFDPPPQGPGNLRTDYLLPSAALSVRGAGVFWPEPGAPLAEAAARASRHKMVWVDIAWP